MKKKIIGAIVERGVNRTNVTNVAHNFGTGYKIGEIQHDHTVRLESLKLLIETSGLSATISNNIHKDIWIKLIGNICINPLSVLEEKAIGKLLSNSQTVDIMKHLAQEVENVGIKLGVIEKSDFDFDNFVNFMATNLGKHESSMLQDFRKGRVLEIHRIVEVVIMLANLEGIKISIPTLLSIHRDLILKTSSIN